MGHLTFELILWLLLTFFIGCILGSIFRKLFGGKAVEPVVVETKPAPKQKPEPKAERKIPVASGVAKRPKGIAAARDGKPDELQRISGVGPKLGKTLNSLGYFHFDQIAKWTPDEVQWVDEHLRFTGRINRDEWLPQSTLLAAGNEAEFSKVYGRGKSKNKKSDKVLSGPNTKKP